VNLVLMSSLLVNMGMAAPMHLTLTEAHRLAIESHPQIAASRFNAAAAGQVVREVRSNYMPTAFGSITGVGADSGSRIAAGALNNPVLYNRLGTGVGVSQLLLDFGRTGNLVESAKYRAQAQDQVTEAVKDDVLVTVDRAYYGVLRAKSLLTVAESTVAARQLIVDQISALVASKLKSNLDLSFASVNLADAKLLLANAQNDVKAAAAELATALGSPGQEEFDLAEEPLPDSIPADLNALLNEGIKNRPELASLRLEESAALKFVRAERALAFPTFSSVAAAGFSPAGETSVPGRYGAIGLNLNIPIFNGSLYSARRAEAEFRAKSVERNIKDLENRVVREIRLAWLSAQNAYERLGLTAQLLDQAKLALDLARTRYDLGLGSIVEVSQAQLNFTSAQIASAAAKYDYQAQRSRLAYQIGAIR
jgi:outer membrane protein